MTLSQNGWPVITSRDDPYLHNWIIPAKTGETHFLFRQGAAGFLLAFLALWFAEKIEPLKGKIWDEWGWALRDIRGMPAGNVSNHASGTAGDFNSTKHPMGVVSTYKQWQYDRLHTFLRRRLKGAIRWGADYSGRKDEMHFEIVQNLSYCEKLARYLMKYTWRGRRILKANPGQRRIILS